MLYIFTKESRSNTIPTTLGGKADALIALYDHMRVPGCPYMVPNFVVLDAPIAATRDIEVSTVATIMNTIQATVFAVRSSAVGEDGVLHSMAGQFDSILHVTRHTMIEAIQQVFDSMDTDSVRAYCDQHGIAPQSLRMNVIVQAMITPDMAGIAFAQDPIYGARGYALVSSTSGLADALAAGTINGSQWYVKGDSILMVEHPTTEACNAYEHPTRRKAIVDAAQLTHLTSDIFGAPQDIEWAYANNQVYLLQSRPITTGHDNTDPLPEQIQWALHSDYRHHAPQPQALLDNSNIVESYPGIVSPLTFSFAQRAYAATYKHFMRLMEVPTPQIAANHAVFDHMLEHVDGRVYYRLEHWYHALSMLPGYQINATFMGTMMGLKDTIPDKFAPPAPKRGGWNTMLSIGRTARSLMAITHAAVRLPTIQANFMQRIRRAQDRMHAIPKDPGLPELILRYKAIEQELLLEWDAPLINDFLCMIAFGVTKKWLHACAGDDGVSLHNAFMIDQGDIISASPAALIHTMANKARGNTATMDALQAQDHDYLIHHSNIATEYVTYIDQFGHRCTEELKLESLSLHVDPSPLIHAIVASTLHTHTTATHTATPITVHDVRNATNLSRFKAYMLHRALLYTRNRVRDRENLRYTRTQAFGMARELIRHIGDRFTQMGILESTQDIFLLPIQDVVSSTYITGPVPVDTLRDCVIRAKHQQAQNHAIPNPPERWMYNQGSADIIPHQGNIPKDATQYTGTPCSAGSVTGRAYVVENPRDATLSPGDILVAHHTDPGWISLFANAAGVVVEKGSPLSHSAIVSREMNIPCVVAIPGVCQWIPHGAIIRVNGTTGEVAILADHSTPT